LRRNLIKFIIKLITSLSTIIIKLKVTAITTKRRRAKKNNRSHSQKLTRSQTTLTSMSFQVNCISRCRTSSSSSKMNLMSIKTSLYTRHS
jgi:hypothetical protein